MKRNKMDLKSLTSLSKNQMLKIIGGSGNSCGVGRECTTASDCNNADCDCVAGATYHYCHCKKDVPSCT